MPRFLLVTVSLFFFSTILYSQKGEVVNLKLTITVCPPQWVSVDSDSTTIQQFQEHILNDSILVSHVFVSGKHILTCAGCQCPSGKTLYVVADRKNYDYFQKLGFVEVVH